VHGRANGSGTVVACVLAGGSGTRLGAEVNKVLLPLGTGTVLGTSLTTLDRTAAVDHVVVVARDADLAEVTAMVRRLGLARVRSVVPGGATRHGSEVAALRAAEEVGAATDDDVILIHDGARPFLTHRLVAALVDAARDVGGAVPGIAVTGVLWDLGEPVRPRSAGATRPLRRMQTPQAFRARTLLAAYADADADGFDGVDTASTVERYTSLAIRVVASDPRNLKITTPVDLEIARALTPSFVDGAWVG
jgi:2-C-methyl-D-erythritol 4-phosphate cytidylyltransferase